MYIFQSSFSQLNYIPEAQPLFEKDIDIPEKDTSSAVLPANNGASSQDTPVALLTKDGVGAGMVAVRAMYLNNSVDDSAEKESPASGPRDAVPFQSLPESPDVSKDLFNSLNAESQVGGTPANVAPVPTQEPSRVIEAPEVSVPSVGETWIQCYDEESGWPYVFNEATGEVKWVEPESTEQLMAELWEVCYDEDGNQFYYNPVRKICLTI